MSKSLNKQQREILRSATSHAWHVDDENIVDVAELIKRGLVHAISDYEHIGIHGTDKGIKLALRLKLIQHGEHGRFGFGEAEP